MLISEDKNKIVEALLDGKVIAIKTDTVYGLICDAFNKNATDKIYSIKRRETKKPISIFVRNIDDLKKYVDEKSLTDKVLGIMKKNWPGPLTIILKKKKDMFENITLNLDSIGIRIPNDRFLLSILDELPFPLAETSCNISGEKEYDNADIINEKLGCEIDYIVDGGKIKNNIASTVINVDDDNIIVLRQGDIKIDE